MTRSAYDVTTWNVAKGILTRIRDITSTYVAIVFHLIVETILFDRHIEKAMCLSAPSLSLSLLRFEFGGKERETRR